MTETINVYVTQKEADAVITNGLHSRLLTSEQNALATAVLPNLLEKAKQTGKAGYPLNNDATVSIYVQ